MTGPRRWWWRAGLAVLLYAAAMAATTALQDDPDPVRMALVVAVLVAAGALLLDAAGVPSAFWPVDPWPTTALGRADPRTATYLRILEGHLTAATVDTVLRDRLRELTDRTLRTRLDLTLDDPRAGAVLDPELRAVLEGPAQRLSARQIARLVDRIEAL